MRVLIAPGPFAGTLTAGEAARAVADGWRSRAPGDELDLAPVADGGSGFVEVLHAALGGHLLAVAVRDPLGGTVPATVLRAGDTAYVASAQACAVGPGDPATAERASSYGVGQLVAAAVGTGARRVVVGVGPSAATDGGAGLLAALGARADRALDAGPVALDGVREVDLSAARAAVAGVELVVAHDVPIPLTGLFGTAKAAGVERGIAEERVPAVDGLLEGWAAAAGRRTSLEPGAGAGGGVGYGLLLLGAAAAPGVELVLGAVGLEDRARAADLVVTGEGRLDPASRTGKAPHGVAQVATRAVRPCVVVAGEVLVGTREMRAMGVETAYAVVDVAGREAATSDPYDALARTAARVARAWSR
ncbi:glycerate kinase [Nocardioides sp. ChNu-153]|uniref:glycerate kinase n=1 Tax=unclassified Nocardioides TaxID=2615069 RepID=UPI0024073C42|nr:MULTISPECIES: glycerate kinase [unclassified Nocardioides]MDF9715948.1 glycerate kinase [Nocardioides sp. ChNu-99]MDN7122941.1 glycerate kinase [Nocardioides sp. ChNu-153]